MSILSTGVTLPNTSDVKPFRRVHQNGSLVKKRVTTQMLKLVKSAFTVDTVSNIIIIIYSHCTTIHFHILAIIKVLALPPRLSLRSHVSTESRYGMYI